jgi:cation diffusion facilitator family transporter
MSCDGRVCCVGKKASKPGDRPSKADDVQNHSLKSRAAAVSIASNATLIVFKLTVGIMSGSIAIISEALHSGSDLVAALIAFWSVRSAAQPPDERHHYGHEKVENLSGVIEALLIIAAAAVIIFEGVMKIIHGPSLDHIWLGIGVMVVSGIANLIVSKRVLYPVARRTDSAALEADAAHLLTDVYTSFGVAAGLLLVKITGWEYFDPVAAIAVAVLIIHTGYELVMQSTRVLLDETLPDDELEEIRRCVREHRGDIIYGYHRLRARRAGSRRHVDLHVTVNEDLTITEAHDIAEHIEEDIRACIPNTDVLVHVEPRSPDRVDDG